MPKISDLPTDTAPASTDLIPFVDVDAARTESVTVANLAASAAFSGQYVTIGTGLTALYLPGSSGNYVSCPDAAALDITGDIDIRVRLAAVDWSPGTTKCIAAKSDDSTQKSWRIDIDSAGTPIFRWSADGSAQITKTCTDVAALPEAASDGAPLWFRVTLDVDNGASGNDVKFYKAADSEEMPTSWTQIGTTVTTAGVTSIFDSTAVVELGSLASGTSILLAAEFYRFQLRSGIDGTVVADIDLSVPVGPRHLDGYGNLWTMNGSAWAWSFR